MKIVLGKNKKIIGYKSKDGLFFKNKENCIFYETNYMWRA